MSLAFSVTDPPAGELDRQNEEDQIDDHKLTLALPSVVVRQLRGRMAVEDTTLRALILDALRRAGYAVPAAEIRDRRRSRKVRRPAGA